MNSSLKDKLKISFENKNFKSGEIAFLKARVEAKTCLMCDSKATFISSTEKTIVDDICCENFAKLIGNSISIERINNYAIEFRGKILNTYCLLENTVDAIIELTYTKYPSAYHLHILDEFPKEMQMRERKQFFKIALDKHNELTKTNIDKIWGHFCNILEKRNQLAHWSVDTTQKGVNLLGENHRIRFTNMKMLEIIDEETYNSKNTELLSRKITKLTIELFTILKLLQVNK